MTALPPSLLTSAKAHATETHSQVLADAPKNLRHLLARVSRLLEDLTRTPAELARSAEPSQEEEQAFNRHFSCPLEVYVTRQRLTMSAYLLEHSQVPVSVIARALGFPSPSQMGRSFKKEFGITPGERRARAADAASGSVMKTTPSQDTTPVQWRHLLLGATPQKQRHEMIAKYRWQLVSTPEGRAYLEQSIAERIAEHLGRHPDMLSNKSHNILRFTTPALFERLVALSRELGRQDRHLGVRVAAEALASLGPLRGDLSEIALAGLEARGWAWLGNAHRLAAEFGAAREAFQRAEHLLPLAESPLVSIEVYSVKLTFLRFQGQFAEVLECADRALDLCEEVGEQRHCADIAFTRAVVLRESGDLSEAIRSLEELFGRIDRGLP